MDTEYLSKLSDLMEIPDFDVKRKLRNCIFNR